MRAFWLALIIAAFTNGPAIGDTLMATRTIRSKTILTAADVFVVKDDLPAIFDSADDVIGLEARVVLYQGRPIRPEDVGPAATIERNQIVTIRFQSRGLSISADGRALGRAAPGDLVRVMNLASRTIIMGRVDTLGQVTVGPTSIAGGSK